ncbi:MAG TPA: hypothetical protein VNI61_08060 [Gemmatimonadales bacterium]|nr:hypothetical protein [Gemmatimonadales bacterium]
MGRVTAVAWPGQEGLAAALAEAADRAPAFPGIGPLAERPFTLVLAPSRARFDSVTRGRLPAWSDGAAFPEAGVIVLLARGGPSRLPVQLRHELAHLALRWHVGRALPVWFEEGYASVAAREWDRFDGLRLNWTLARGAPPTLEELERRLRSEREEAAGAYALATTAVLLLERWGGGRGLEPLLANAGRAPSFDAALRVTYGVTEGDFEARWHADLRSRYGWLAWGAAAALAWGLGGALVFWLGRRRRRRDRARRAGLDGAAGLAGDDAPTP